MDDAKDIDCSRQFNSHFTLDLEDFNIPSFNDIVAGALN